MAEEAEVVKEADERLRKMLSSRALQISLQHTRQSTIEAQASEINALKRKLARMEKEKQEALQELDAAHLHVESEKHCFLEELDAAYDTMEHTARSSTQRGPTQRI